MYYNLYLLCKALSQRYLFTSAQSLLPLGLVIFAAAVATGENGSRAEKLGMTMVQNHFIAARIPAYHGVLPEMTHNIVNG